ncbi:bifunctional hydroxymethylpyrimidine kinase/phosphomethylpyrimidine kinase [Geodermatophilus sp. DSM 44513]|uniref:bifunctional hydroxymethylpyrimidine kinase/phosphomethylpyrimidine kinase n=1 Tax=Geodermatophilus sp. DSM 44513 TaxID=1528104 RepID=UPI00126CE9A5|nr:bifunctional hydroxymethylpyrimidine kinase/phosphomethylpyrimidine kinase [Geodermatophilus sp. DSM 44513]WNV75220.1 bifunctional hydroxymethylpyrimidine kinase/phosphomethylpyrimidine kinase [Geodermatophilus sp. DSM 44513]
MTPPVALTIAGSDSSGGAGIQADLKTFAALGVYGTSAITALTAQNTRGVRGIHPVPAEFVLAQVDAVLDDLPVAAVKTGMLATAENVQSVADLAAAGRLPRLVVDPVMVASSGDRLLEPQAEQLYRTALFPHAAVVTPNLREAEVLLDVPIRTLAEQQEAARALGALGPSAVVVKGGHPVTDEAEEAVDVVWDGEAVYELRGARIDTPNNHGTGCTFASATAAALATGTTVRDALTTAKDFVTRAIVGGAAWRLGHGHGPLDHFMSTSRRSR